jgi:hypothetical protein
MGLEGSPPRTVDAVISLSRLGDSVGPSPWKTEPAGRRVFLIPAGLLGVGLVLVLLARFFWPPSCGNLPTGFPICSTTYAYSIMAGIGAAMALCAVASVPIAILYRRSRRHLPLPS